MPDDYSDNLQTTGTVALGASTTGQIETAGDRDKPGIYRLTVTEELAADADALNAEVTYLGDIADVFSPRPRSMLDGAADPVNYCRFMMTAVALGALALVALLGLLSPTAHAVTCGAAQRGSLNADNTFTRGTTPTHHDYRISCTGDSSGREVKEYDLAAAFEHDNADAIGSLNGRLVIELSNAHLRVDKNYCNCPGLIRPSTHT